MPEFDYSAYFWQGAKVRLRPHHPSDWEAKYAEFIDSSNRRTLQGGLDCPNTADNYQKAFSGDNRIEDAKGNLGFAIENLEGQFIGWANIHARDARNGTFSCGMGIFAPYRGSGCGEDALRIILRYAFNELRCQKCNLTCLANNQASIGMQKKLGFVQEGLRRRVVYTEGRLLDEYLSGITREEFLENDAAYLEKMRQVLP